MYLLEKRETPYRAMETEQAPPQAAAVLNAPEENSPLTDSEPSIQV